MGLFSALRTNDTEPYFVQLQQMFDQQRAGQADTLTVKALAGEIADRSDIPFINAFSALVGVASAGGPDLRTPKGWACASVILGAPGAPILPTVH